MIIYLNSVGTFMYHDGNNKLVYSDCDSIALLEDLHHLYTIDGHCSLEVNKVK